MGKHVVVLALALALVAASCQASPEPNGRPVESSSRRCPEPRQKQRRQIEVARPSDASTRIIVDASQRLAGINPLVYGVNHRYPYSGFNMWDTDEGRINPLFRERFDYSGLTIVRFPGGRTANNYHWDNAIGPIDERGLHIDAAFGRTRIHNRALSNEFGPDEFGRFLDITGTEGSIVVNFPTGTAREAADWVEYMNAPVGENPRGGTAWAEVRADNGHPDPYGIKYWEVGNELAGEKTFWIGGNTTLAERAPKYIFGGSTSFTKQAVHTRTDFTPSGTESTGEPSQTFFVRYPPVQPNSETVYAGGERWTAVDDLASAGPDNVYEFDPQAGKITFGDGTHGNIPEKGARVAVTHVSGPHDGYVDFYREMKEADPSIEVGSALNAPAFTETMGSEHPYDFLVAHSYSYFRATPSDLRDLHDLMMTLPDVQADKVEVVLDQIERDAGPRAAEVELVITEWAMATGFNIGLGRIEAPPSYAQTVDGALYTGLVLRHWLRLGIPVAQRHTLIDINPEDPPPGYTKERTAYQAVIGPYPCFLVTAPALAYRLFTRMTGDEVVSSEIVENPVKTIFTGATLESLATVASTDELGNLYVIVINSNLEDPVKTAVAIDGFSTAGSGRAWTLTGAGHLASNSLRRPNRVRIEEAALEKIDGAFAYEFPPHSITALKLEGASD